MSNTMIKYIFWERVSFSKLFINTVIAEELDQPNALDHC